MFPLPAWGAVDLPHPGSKGGTRDAHPLAGRAIFPVFDPFVGRGMAGLYTETVAELAFDPPEDDPAR